MPDYAQPVVPRKSGPQFDDYRAVTGLNGFRIPLRLPPENLIPETNLTQSFPHRQIVKPQSDPGGLIQAGWAIEVSPKDDAPDVVVRNDSPQVDGHTYRSGCC